eukprot:NODE_9718_length_1403_cov_6.112853.p1 GENE.NODE_9718_length_1403_cov_6.112853~~NODE_9718_length_1403_cov_6.112853.p1  ORF type:complete len:276 (-),score=67.93 NODE_9718_length_1403_cov_6.112853:389-1216(-)
MSSVCAGRAPASVNSRQPPARPFGPSVTPAGTTPALQPVPPPGYWMQAVPATSSYPRPATPPAAPELEVGRQEVNSFNREHVRFGSRSSTPTVAQRPDAAAAYKRVLDEVASVAAAGEAAMADIALAAEIASQLQGWFAHNAAKMQAQDERESPSVYLSTATEDLKRHINVLVGDWSQVRAALSGPSVSDASLAVPPHTFMGASRGMPMADMRCPGGHRLTASTRPTAACDGCNAYLSLGTSRFGCRTCDFDLCCRCFHAAAPFAAAAVTAAAPD